MILGVVDLFSNFNMLDIKVCTKARRKSQFGFTKYGGSLLRRLPNKVAEDGIMFQK
jgi:hypothetical protein